jgi:DNA polymerase (family X)
MRDENVVRILFRFRFTKLARGVLIAVNTDAHGTGELPLIRCGINQARRAGLEKTTVLNCLPWEKLQPLFRR